MKLRGENLMWSVGRTRIVNDVSLSCASGTLTGLLGPNGSGKTSLLRLLGGLQRPDSGRVHVGDQPLDALGPRARAKRIALVEQHASTSLRLTVRQVVELGRIPHRGRWPAARSEGREQVEEGLRVGEVVELADRYWDTLSGGERQRVQLARALAQEPDILVLDEPTNHLDPGHQLAFMQLVRELDVTVVAALHDLDLAAAFCDRLVVLDGGSVVADGTPEEVLQPPLIERVYGVRTTVDRHLPSGRLHVTWMGADGV